MTKQTGARLSVSTWSLHHALGQPPRYGPGQEPPPASNDGDGFSLLDLPQRIAELGIHTLEICHFHLPSRDPADLAALRQALEAANVELFSLLIDGGDITHPEHAERDWAWIAGWIDVADQLGATCARVIAGQADPSPAALARSAAGLRRLADRAQACNVRLMTENWLGLLSRPQAVQQLLDELDGAVGLCVDFGNWRGATKYDDLAAILPYAESCHAKCFFDDDGEPQRTDFERCLQLARQANFAGPYTLIYEGPRAQEWNGLRVEREMVLPYISSHPSEPS